MYLLICHVLFSQFPPFEQICGVMLDRPSMGTTGSWSDMIVCEFLYARPNIAPADIMVIGEG